MSTSAARFDAASNASATGSLTSTGSASASSSSAPASNSVPTTGSSTSAPTTAVALLPPSSDGAPSSLVLTPAERRLFCTHTVTALKQLAEDKRNASDDKKEELRQLVGIRYRVLIETADSIMTMQAIVEDTAKQLTDVQQRIPNIGLGELPSASSTQRSGRMSQLQLLLLLRSYALAPASIWSSLDSFEYESALALVLSMQAVREQIESVEFVPRDSEELHPQLRALVEAALSSVGPASASASGASTPHGKDAPPAVDTNLIPALASFFQQHAAYHSELPSLIASSALRRLQHQRALGSRSYADCVTALALLLRHDSPAPGALGLQLLDVFLDSKRAQLSDLVWSAERALGSFLSAVGTAVAVDPTPILVHACQNLLFTLQYTLVDVALLFAQTSPAGNPNAKLVSSSSPLLAAWKDCAVAERVKAFWARVASDGKHAQSTAAAASPAATAAAAAVTIDSAVLGQRVAAWLVQMQSFLHDALLTRLLPFLLPTAPSSSGTARRSGASSCQSLQRLREEILHAANFDAPQCYTRDGESKEPEPAKSDAKSKADDAVTKHAQSQRKLSSTAREEEEADTDGHRSAALKKKRSQDASASAVLSPAEQARLARKRALERFDETCTLLFGMQSPSQLALSPVGSSASAQSFGAPLSLFDAFFFSPLASFTNSLGARAFERLTLLRRMDRLLQPRKLNSDSENKPQDSSSEEKKTLEPAESKSSSGGEKGGKSKRNEEKSKILAEDDFDLNTLTQQAKAAATSAEAGAARGSSTQVTGAADLNGRRENEVQEIVSVFRRQLVKLGRDCAALLDCQYVSRPVSAPPTTSSKHHTSGSKDVAAPILFPALSRYLQEDLAQRLSKKYSSLVEQLVEQLKKKLADLEQHVLHSMSDVAVWRSAATLELVEQSVFIGRVCTELIKQRQLTSLDTLLAAASAGHARRSSAGVSTSGAAGGAPSSVQVSLSTTARQAYRVWTRYLATVLSEEFAQDLAAWIDTQKATQAQGEKHCDFYFHQLFSNKNHVGSAPLGLPLPLHATPGIFHLLSSLHSHYHRLFGFRVHRELLEWLISDVGAALLGVLENRVLGIEADGLTGALHPGATGGAEKILPSLPSYAVLQLQFDVQFLFGVLRLPATGSDLSKAAGGPKGLTALSGTSLDARARFAKLVSAFESHCASPSVLDQINWREARPNFGPNVQAALARSAMMFGLLTKSNPFPPLLPQSGAGIGSNPAESPLASPLPASSPSGAGGAALINILPLAAPIQRIAPLSASLYPSKHPQPVDKLAAARAAVAAASAASASAALASSLAVSSPAPAPTAGSAGSSSLATVGGLSFSALGSQLSSLASTANTSAQAKAIGDLGSSLLGKLSTTWGVGGSSTKK